jgi:gamma-glutamyltranspeptidase/glutathione hydrolase
VLAHACSTDAYLRSVRGLIGAAQSMGTRRPGQPAPPCSPGAAQPDQPEHGTSHISIVDAEGRAVAMTTTIEAAFGARIMSDGGTGLAGGFLLNNQLTDFSLHAGRRPGPTGGQPRAARQAAALEHEPDAGVRPPRWRLLMSLGSPGGAAIIHFTAKTLIATLDWGLDAQRAIDLPNFGSFNGPTVLESIGSRWTWPTRGCPTTSSPANGACAA